jgi:hypothetical protein
LIGVEKDKPDTKEKKKVNEFSDFDFELDNKLSFDIGDSKPDPIWDSVTSKTKKKGITEIDNPPATAKEKSGSKWDDYNGCMYSYGPILSTLIPYYQARYWIS